MKNIYLDIKDKILKQTLSDLFAVFDFKFVEKSKADFVIKDLCDRIVVNDKKFFMKPVDIFSVVRELNQDSNLFFGKLCLKLKEKIVEFDKKTISLTDIETKILSSIIENKNGILNSDLSLAVFSKINESCLKSLITHIYNLKRKLESITGKQKNIIFENSKYFLDL